MERFATFITEEKNTHMEHLEDLVLNDGIEGARGIFNFLTNLGAMLAGDVKTAVSTTVKWDGAPAIFMGIDPADGEFFVAKKGLFNKKPKLYKTVEDINVDLSGELNAKFKIALKEFSKLGIKDGVVQGDMMFTSSDLENATIDGTKYITFQPNTIVYAIPIGSALAKTIKKAKIGVVWHTTYTGNSIDSMSASFGKDITKRLKKVGTVWQDDATYKDLSGKATMTASETKEFRKLVSAAGSLLRKIPSASLNAISKNPELLILVKTFNNTFVRDGKRITNTKAHARKLVKWIDAKFAGEINKRKTAKGKDAQRAKKQSLLGPLLNIPVQHLVAIFDFMNIIVDAKTLLIRKKEQASSMNTFLRTKTGYTITGAEGFVAIDHLKGGAVKLVDRLQFSHANFSPEILKGWQV